jgi:K+-transporting ATPase ATPase C chain
VANNLKLIKTSFIFLFIMTMLTGLVYPFFITTIAQLFFPWQANGSLIQNNNKTIGSALIGQSFIAPSYFWGRPSATSPFPYNATNSSGSNLSPSNPVFLDIVKKRLYYLQQHNEKNSLIPVDLVTASGSGLDPDISPLAAFYQAPRVAKANHLTEQKIATLIKSLIKTRDFFILGEPRVNVLELNLALQKLKEA